MERLFIRGNCRLQGQTTVHGAKNAALPILAGTLLCPRTVLHNCPALLDVAVAGEILQQLGCGVWREGDTLTVQADSFCYAEPAERLLREMRSSILFLGALLARCGRAKISLPGGCELGARPVDLHIEGLRRMGAVIEEAHGFFCCEAPNGLHGAQIALAFPSVGATENLMLAAATAKGETLLQNAAREPEIEDLAAFLNAAGGCVQIFGDTVHIKGVPALHEAEHAVMPDRIEAATLLCAAAVTGGEVVLQNVAPAHLAAVLPLLRQMGCTVQERETAIALRAPARLQPVGLIKTMPYPGFPTDLQAPFMAALCLADGVSILEENIFEARYKHVGELARMGARIKVAGRIAVIEGVPALHSASVRCTDLRGGAALVLAALAAEGESELTELRHLDRGYADLENGLRALGATIKRIKD